MTPPPLAAVCRLRGSNGDRLAQHPNARHSLADEMMGTALTQTGTQRLVRAPWYHSRRPDEHIDLSGHGAHIVASYGITTQESETWDGAANGAPPGRGTAAVTANGQARRIEFPTP
jgi:hypothetical protein